MKSKLLIILVLFFNHVVFSQQLVDVKDTVLAGILCDRYPDAMVNNCTQIDLSKEAFISDTIDVENVSLTDVSPLLELTETVYLRLNNVEIDTLNGNFSKLVNLEFLDLSHNTEFSYFPDFSTISSPTFEILAMTHAYISGPLEISNLKNSLIYLNIRNNAISTVPDLTDFPHLEYANILGNKLTFYDLAPFLEDTDTHYELMKQRTVGLIPRAILDRYEGTPFEFIVDVDFLHPDNIYYWHKNNSLFDTTDEPSLQFTSLELSDSGTYHLIIRNSNFTDAQDSIFGREVILKVIEKPEECVELENANVEVLTTCQAHQIVCNDIEIDSITYELRLESDTFFIKGAGNVFVNINEGEYELRVSTPFCEVIYPELVELKDKNDCDQLISPNGDGIGDQYYIDLEEKVKIVNKSGQILNELQGPVLWDGTDTTGSIIDAGYYLLVFESGDVIAITVER